MRREIVSMADVEFWCYWPGAMPDWQHRSYLLGEAARAEIKGAQIDIVPLADAPQGYYPELRLYGYLQDARLRRLDFAHHDCASVHDTERGYLYIVERGGYFRDRDAVRISTDLFRQWLLRVPVAFHRLYLDGAMHVPAVPAPIQDEARRKVEADIADPAEGVYRLNFDYAWRLEEHLAVPLSGGGRWPPPQAG